MTSGMHRRLFEGRHLVYIVLGFVTIFKVLMSDLSLSLQVQSPVTRF